MVKVAANIRTNVKRGKERKPMGVIPNILFWPWEPVEGDTSTYLGAIEETIQFHFVELPSLAEAEAIHQEWKQKLADTQANDARDWETSVARRYTDWSEKLVEAVQRGAPHTMRLFRPFGLTILLWPALALRRFLRPVWQ